MEYPKEDHECAYDNGDGKCKECSDLAALHRPGFVFMGYMKSSMPWLRTGKHPEDHDLCCFDDKGAFPVWREETPNV